ncbi:hypothetical protein CBR_g54996 [Chara braunii]|uniref:DUF659 domain-containing protein n=1 Tax=Chara braunii TaxID=69332 RepID=A0A388K7K6_CHABU|nr:hypothetical protein CBR_g54996 [Chara braunii]|eukprot:GBG66016.1 hypothetical protein CBR_g54996 [Chara braunii]
MGDGRRGQEGAARAMKEAAGSKNRKRKAKMTTTEARSAPSQPKKSRVLRQTSMLETFDPVWQREFSDSVLLWWYVSGIPFEAARRPEYHRMRKKLLECPPYAHPALPMHRVISCEGIPQQQRVVADMVAAIRRDIEATGVTILTDGRKSITNDQIVNFLVAGPTGAYLFRTVQRDGAVQETAEAVVERWKDVFEKFGVDKVNAICTDSSSAYVAASKLLAQEEVKYSRITWLPCAVHVCNLLLSGIAKDGRDGSLGKREDTIIRARVVVRFIREHGAALSLYRRFSAAHPSSASAAAGGSSSAPPSSQRRGRELVYPVQTRFATHYLMLERLLDRRRALEALMMSDDWLRTAWRRSIFLQARWVRHQVRYAPFWEHVEDIVALMTPVMQLLWRLDRGGRVMTRMWSWGFIMVDRVARASLNRTSKDELHIVLQACQARVAHMLEPAHCMAHLLNPWQRSISFFGAARRTDHERILADESLRYLRQQTGGDKDLYQTLHTQLAEFHSRASPAERNWAVHERVQVKRRNQLGLIKLTRLVEISTNLRLSCCQGRGSGYILPWEDAEEETKDAIPPPRDEGVRPADQVTEAQRDRQVQRGRKDRLSKAPPSVATYFGRRATVLMAHELESVYDPEPDPMALDAMEAEPWSDPNDLAVESEPGGSDDDDDDTPLMQISRRADTGKVRRESASSTRTVHWVDEERPAEAAVVAPSPMEVAPSPAEFATTSAEGASASAEGPGGFAGGSGDAGEVGRPSAQSVALRARVARMLETGVEAGDAEGECGVAGIGDAGERPASPVQGVCVLPLGGAMSAGELERQAQEDPLQADRPGRMTEASMRLMAEAPAYVPCSPSVPSSTTGVSTPAYAEGTVAAEAVRGPSPTPAGEFPSPQSRKKKMRAGKNAAGWLERVSDRATDQPMSAPVEATLPHSAGRTAGTGDHAEHSAPPGRSMAARILREDVRAATTQRPSQAPVVWESGTDDLEMPYGLRRRVSVYDLLRPQGGVEAAPQGEIYAPDTTRAPAGGTGRGDGVTGVVPQRRRKDIVDDDDA